jgi:hypothetical protein
MGVTGSYAGGRVYHTVTMRPTGRILDGAHTGGDIPVPGTGQCMGLTGIHMQETDN